MSPGYQIYPSFFGQCANSQSLPVPNRMIKVNLPRSAEWLTASWCIILEEMVYNIPESRRSMIREGVPTPMPILIELAPRFEGQERDRSEIPCFLDIIYCLSQLDMFGKEFCHDSIFGLKDA